MNPTETEPIARLVTIHNVDELAGPTDKGKQRCTTPTPEPMTNKDEAAVVDRELQMELAGLKTLAKQGLVLQDPKVSSFVCSVVTFTDLLLSAIAVLHLTSFAPETPFVSTPPNVARLLEIEDGMLIHGHRAEIHKKTQQTLGPNRRGFGHRRSCPSQSEDFSGWQAPHFFVGSTKNCKLLHGCVFTSSDSLLQVVGPPASSASLAIHVLAPCSQRSLLPFRFQLPHPTG